MKLSPWQHTHSLITGCSAMSCTAYSHATGIATEETCSCHRSSEEAQQLAAAQVPVEVNAAPKFRLHLVTTVESEINFQCGGKLYTMLFRESCCHCMCGRKIIQIHIATILFHLFFALRQWAKCFPNTLSQGPGGPNRSSHKWSHLEINIFFLAFSLTSVKP